MYAAMAARGGAAAAGPTPASSAMRLHDALKADGRTSGATSPAQAVPSVATSPPSAPVAGPSQPRPPTAAPVAGPSRPKAPTVASLATADDETDELDELDEPEAAAERRHGKQRGDADVSPPGDTPDSASATPSLAATVREDALRTS